MGADNHPTPRVETDDKDVKRERLKADLAMCTCVTDIRDSMLAGLVVETTQRGWEPEALHILAKYGARIGTNKDRDDPWEVFLE